VAESRGLYVEHTREALPAPAWLVSAGSLCPPGAAHSALPTDSQEMGTQLSGKRRAMGHSTQAELEDCHLLSL
jgi:hypothetical protein